MLCAGLYDMGNLAAVCRSADGEMHDACCPAHLCLWQQQWWHANSKQQNPHPACSEPLLLRPPPPCSPMAALGFGAVHCVMRPTDKYKRSQRTAAGADKWLDTRLWDSTPDCLSGLKAAGYQVVATHLDADARSIQV